jgi:alanyl-tRNA synthetase
VEIDDFSRELCGGTHVGATSELGIFKIVSEGSVGANVRRIEAVCGRSGVAYYRDRDDLVKQAVRKLGIAEDQLLPTLDKVQARLDRLEAEVKRFVSESAKDVIRTLADGAETHAGVRLVSGVVDARDMDHLLALVDQIRDRAHPAVVALGATFDGKATLVVAVSKGVSQVDAGQVVKTASRAFRGGGGGNAQLGRGGGGDPSLLSDAIGAARQVIVAALAG